MVSLIGVKAVHEKCSQGGHRTVAEKSNIKFRDESISWASSSEWTEHAAQAGNLFSIVPPIATAHTTRSSVTQRYRLSALHTNHHEVSTAHSSFRFVHAVRISSEHSLPQRRARSVPMSNTQLCNNHVLVRFRLLISPRHPVINKIWL